MFANLKVANLMPFADPGRREVPQYHQCHSKDKLCLADMHMFITLMCRSSCIVVGYCLHLKSPVRYWEAGLLGYMHKWRGRHTDMGRPVLVSSR
jgi:hypothetical protein